MAPPSYFESMHWKLCKALAQQAHVKLSNDEMLHGRKKVAERICCSQRVENTVKTHHHSVTKCPNQALLHNKPRTLSGCEEIGFDPKD